MEMNLIKRYRNDILYFQLSGFADLDYVNHLFTFRIGWKKENIEKKYRIYLRYLQII